MISNEIEFETEENDMIAEKLRIFRRSRTKNGENGKNGDMNLGFYYFRDLFFCKVRLLVLIPLNFLPFLVLVPH
jgi:hypothetical protein